MPLRRSLALSVDRSTRVRRDYYAYMYCDYPIFFSHWNYTHKKSSTAVGRTSRRRSADVSRCYIARAKGKQKRKYVFDSKQAKLFVIYLFSQLRSPGRVADEPAVRTVFENRNGRFPLTEFDSCRQRPGRIPRSCAAYTAVDVRRGRGQYVDVCTSVFIACNLRTDVHDGRISDVFPMPFCVVGAVAALLVPGVQGKRERIRPNAIRYRRQRCNLSLTRGGFQTFFLFFVFATRISKNRTSPDCFVQATSYNNCLIGTDCCPLSRPCLSLVSANVPKSVITLSYGRKPSRPFQLSKRDFAYPQTKETSLFWIWKYSPIFFFNSF